MRSRQLVRCGAAALLAVLACGCRVGPVRLPLMLVGAAIDEATLREYEPELIGKAPEMADAMFGRRLDTFSDVNSDAKLLVYLVVGEKSLGSRYVVEATGNTITALYKTQRDIDGMADTIQCDLIRAEVLGMTPMTIERETDLGKPKLTMRSWRKAGLTRVYDVRKRSDLQGARYCVLRFDERDLCSDVQMVGVSASSKSRGRKD